MVKQQQCISVYSKDLVEAKSQVLSLHSVLGILQGGWSHSILTTNPLKKRDLREADEHRTYYTKSVKKKNTNILS